jgi:hypothetical protein
LILPTTDCQYHFDDIIVSNTFHSDRQFGGGEDDILLDRPLRRLDLSYKSKNYWGFSYLLHPTAITNGADALVLDYTDDGCLAHHIEWSRSYDELSQVAYSTGKYYKYS